MQRVSKIVFLLFLFVYVNQVKSQTPEIKYQNLNIKNGLSHSLVTDMVEDDKGFLWFSTHNGLNRFDGYQFKRYYANKSNKSPLKNRYISLFKDSFGEIWLQYQNGSIGCLNVETDAFRNYKPDSLNPRSISDDKLVFKISGLRYTMFFEDSDRTLWIGTDKGINKYNRASDDFTSFEYDPNNNNSLSSNNVTCIAEDKYGYLWIGTIDGLNRLDKATGEVKRMLTSTLNPELKHEPIISKIFPQEDGTLWIGTINIGLFILKNTNKDIPIIYTQFIDEFKTDGDISSVFEIVKTTSGKTLLGGAKGLFEATNENDKIVIKANKLIKNARIKIIFEDVNGFVWAAGDASVKNHLYLLNKSLDNIEVIDNDENSDNALGKEPINFIKNSKNGLLYIGTVKGGIYKVDINAKKFGIINSNTSSKNFITSNNVYSIFEDSKNNLWVGTSKELNKLNLKTGVTKDFNNFLDIKNDISYEYSKNIDSKRVSVINKAQNYKLWFGAYDYKISLYDPKKNQFLNFHHNPNDPNSFVGWSLRTICVTSDGNTYFGGTNANFCRLNSDGLTFKHYTIFQSKDLLINRIVEDENNLLWLGTSKGLYSFNPITEESNLHIDTSKDSNDTRDQIISLLIPKVHSNNILWIGTANGLKKFDRISKAYVNFNVSDKFQNNNIVGALEDEEGFLWLSTLKGLVKFNPVNNNVKVYSEEDGLQSDEFNENANFKNKDGKMYFGGIKGITFFYPKDIVDNNSQGEVILTELKINQHSVKANDIINGNVILNKSISYTDQITLTNKDKIISIEFTSTNMVVPNKIKYKYKLVGHEKEWNIVNSTQRFANYSNLKQGEYTFTISSTNSDGLWSENPLELKISVIPPFWKTVWFRLLIGAFLLIIFGVYQELKTKKLKQQKVFLESEVKERTIELKKTNKNLKKKNKKISQMSKKIHELDSMKLRFFTNISHEFRTPLTLILGPTQKLIKSPDFNDTTLVKENLNIIHRNSKRLYNLINQLLELPKIDSGSLKLLVSKQDIVANLKDILNIFKSFAKTKNIELKFSSELKKLEMYFDNDKIEKILYNLMSNAIKYSSKNETVSLHISGNKIIDEKNMVSISVRNTGKVVKEEDLKQLFDRFYQIQKKNYTGDISIGIGLSLVKSLVEIHKGKVSVSSNINEGTIFTILLPIDKSCYSSEEVIENTDVKNYTYSYTKSMLSLNEEDDIDDTTIVKEDTPDKDTLTKEATIVIVEDNKDLVSFLFNELNEQYNILTASNGKEGLDLIEEHLPDLVISDVMMPVMDGIALCNELKTNIKISHIPIFLLTAKIDDEHKITGLSTGADDYITKPFNMDTLKLKIGNIIKARKLLISKFSSGLKPIPEGINLNELDYNLLENIVKFVEDNIDKEITGDILGAELGLSKSNLYKKLKDLTGFSVNIYIRNIRLNVAANLLRNGIYSISEVAYAVGFNNPKYFSTCFHKLFGNTPREFMQNENDKLI